MSIIIRLLPVAPLMLPVPVAFRAAVGALRVVLAVAAGEVMICFVRLAAFCLRAAGTGIIRITARRAGRRDNVARREKVQVPCVRASAGHVGQIGRAHV